MKKIFKKHMKTSQFILIIALIGYCLTDAEIINCEELFKEKKSQKNKEQCEKIGSCFYNDLDEKCFETHPCSYGNGEGSGICNKIIPSTDFDKNKCKYEGTTCSSTQRICTDYGHLGNAQTSSDYEYENDDCSKLDPGDLGNYCTLTRGGECRAHYKQCTQVTDMSKCETNIPEKPSQKCTIKSETNPATGALVQTCIVSTEEIYCEDSHLLKLNQTVCSQLNVRTESGKKKCIYNGQINNCQSYYQSCGNIEVINPDSCKNYVPLNPDTNYYEYSEICAFDETTSNKCKAVKRKCNNYNYNRDFDVPSELINEAFCNSLDKSETYYRCAYDKLKNKCYEEYDSCASYTNNKVETDRDGCENIVLTDKTKKCVYDIKEDKCEEVSIEPIYKKCGDYTGKEKKTCESILSTDSNLPYCILDKDSNCIERTFICSEAFTEDDCLNIAKANEENKRCAWNPGCPGCSTPIPATCYEEYIRCEDYLGNSQTECESIKLYDGKICKWESPNRCRSNFKICEDANTEEECKLIAETGVTDKERKVCAWYSGDCIETYKYCSDYRCKTGRSDCEDMCEKKIKPYDESGNNFDIGFKCIYEDNVGCQKVQVACEDAGDNPVLCESYNKYIYDNGTKYCGFFEGKCKGYYKKCEFAEFAEFDSNTHSNCDGNIVQDGQGGNIYKLCKREGNKCVEDSDCTLNGFMDLDGSSTQDSQPYTFYKDLCENIHPNCSFSYDTDNPLDFQCKYKEKTCKEIKFYKDEVNNNRTCEEMAASNPYKKCVLKEDKSGCEEVYKKLSYSTSSISYSQPPDANTESSSDFIQKRINFIIFILGLLF